MRKKLVLLALLGVCILSMNGCSGKSEIKPSTEAETEEFLSDEPMSVEDVYGEYIDLNTGFPLEINAQQYILKKANGFWSYTLECYGFYQYKDNQLIISDSNNIGTLTVNRSKDGIVLSNDKHTYLPEEVYRAFTKVDVNNAGEAVSTDIATITMTGSNVATKVIVPENIPQEPGNKVDNGFEYEADDDKCYVQVDFTYSNDATDPCQVCDILKVSIVYDNKYSFDSNGSDGNMFVSNNEKTRYTLASGTSYGGLEEEVLPLCSTPNTAYIQCPKAVLENPNKPLHAVFILGNDNLSFETIVFDLRSGSVSGSNNDAPSAPANALDSDVESALSAMLEPVVFGTSKEEIMNIINENPNGIDTSDYAITTTKDSKISGYSTMLYTYEFVGFPLKSIIDEIYCLYVLFYFDGDDGGLVDVEYSIRPNTASSDALFNEMLGELVPILTDAYGEPTLGEDMDSRSGTQGLAFTRNMTNWDSKNEGCKYWEWMIPEKQMKVELCYDSLNEVAWLDYRFQ